MSTLLFLYYPAITCYACNIMNHICVLFNNDREVGLRFHSSTQAKPLNKSTVQTEIQR